jgi:hypothetical protein
MHQGGIIPWNAAACFDTLTAVVVPVDRTTEMSTSTHQSAHKQMLQLAMCLGSTQIPKQRNIETP